MPSSSLSVSQAGLVSIFVTVVGFVVGFVPNIAAYQQAIISIGTAAIAFGFLIANEIRAHGEANVRAAKISRGLPVVGRPTA